jgi:hypothetical protein
VIDEIARTLRGIIRVAMGMPANSVRPARQPGPTGDGDDMFATVEVVRAEDVGHPTKTTEDVYVGDVYQHTLQHVDMTKQIYVEVNFFKGAAKDATGQQVRSSIAFERACLIEQRLRLESANLALQQAGLGFLRATNPLDLTESVDHVYESRGRIELTFSLVHRETEQLPTIESAELGLQVEWSPETIEQRTIEVTT